ncbi:Hypothetical predicted protein, partial [Marmota monax]
MDGAFQGAPLLRAAISAAPYSSGRSLCAPPPRAPPHAPIPPAAPALSLSDATARREPALTWAEAITTDSRPTVAS